MEVAVDQCVFDCTQESHRRGAFYALACGVSFGGGQRVPGNLVNSAVNTVALGSLIANRAIQRLAGWASGAFACWAPRLYKYYADHLCLLLQKHPHLCRNFLSSVWSAATFNFGPRTLCYPHRDFSNLAFGWCAITALGRFDSKRGGHLILWDLKLVIQFPAGSTILIPSATIQHSNVRIQPGETRMSFTQYTAGGLFCWVDSGFQTAAQFKVNDPVGKAQFEKLSYNLWTKG